MPPKQRRELQQQRAEGNEVQAAHQAEPSLCTMSSSSSSGVQQCVGPPPRTQSGCVNRLLRSTKGMLLLGLISFANGHRTHLHRHLPLHGCCSCLFACMLAAPPITVAAATAPSFLPECSDNSSAPLLHVSTVSTQSNWLLVFMM